MNEQRRRYLLMGLTLVLVLVWMVVIFHFSAQDQVESDGMSDGIVDKVVILIQDTYNQMSPDEQFQWYDTTALIVRKSAHMTEYAILAFLGFLFYTVWFPKQKRWRYGFAVLLVVVYASSDEFHQTFVKGRAGRVSDVCIDTVGALLCMLVVWLFLRAKEKRRKRRKCIENLT